MKSFNLEQYHVIKSDLQRAIDKAGDTGLARDASTLLSSLEIQLETRVGGLISDTTDTIYRLHRMLEAEQSEQVYPTPQNR